MIEKMREGIREIEARWRITQGWRKRSIRMGRGEKCGQGNISNTHQFLRNMSV